ncbi:MAG: hypothetical protein KGO53_14110, partial [Alphaproteobacteria bacterium]|nr:hypothetical protein [Alphaproteobacteria bacterium]
MTAPEGTSPARMTGLAIAGILLLFAAQLALRFSSSLIHDSAWYLYVAQGLLQGKKLYVDFVEVNPPLGMWLALPAAWAGQVTGASAVGWFYALLFAATAAVLGLSWRYLEQGEHQPLLLVAIAAVLLFAPGDNFGQREHFMLLMVLPWVLLRLQARPIARWWERALVGAVAALGIALKPHAVFVPLFVEAVLLWQRRNWRRLFDVENLAALAAVVVYAAVIALSASVFFSEIIALGRAAYLPYYGFPESLVLLDAKWAVIFMALALFGIRNKAVQVLWAAAAGFLVAYALQNKGFTYHILPATSFA